MNETLTVVIPVRNEAPNIRRCIECIPSGSPIIVVDSGSEDDTVDLAKRADAQVIQFNWNGQFPKKRNWVLRNTSIQTPWVLFLDADEFPPSGFWIELEALLPATNHVGFWLSFENYFMGRKLRGGDPFRKLALFRVGAGEYERIDEDHWSHLDMEVHEHPVLDGTVGEIKTPIEHNDFRGLEHYISKHNAYSSWEAHRYIRLHSSRAESSSEWNNLTERQKKKYRHLAKWWFAPAYFLSSFFFKQGFLDGSVGFHFALMKAIYFYQIRLKIKELKASFAHGA